MGRAAEPADTELVRRAIAGERDAFEALYHRYQAVVYRFARAMTGSPSMAEDVTQEVFVVLMPSRYREVVILCGLHGLSYAEAAGALNAPIGTVRSRLHRGRNLLVERLQCLEPEGSRTVTNCVARCLA